MMLKPRRRWVDVSSYEGRYQVSVRGEVWSLVTGTLLKPGRTGEGYLTVNLRRDGRSRSETVHVLVARAFIPNLLSKRTVNHKNGVRDDNRRSNLEWATHAENHLHAHQVLGRKPYDRAGTRNPRARAVVGGGRRFDTIKAAARHVGVSHAAIVHAIRRQGSSGGVCWTYA